MDSLPLVSILIPNYNKAPYLRETLDSVLDQTYTNWECIIVDDHSTDNSWEILEEYAQKDTRIKIFKRLENRKKGGHAARTYAFEMSKGEFVNWFDSDDIMIPNMIMSKLENFKNADMVVSKLTNFGMNLKRMPSLNLELPLEKRPIKFLKGEFWIGTPLPMFKRSFLQLSNLSFNEELKRNQETEFFIRILLRNPKIVFIEESLMFWRIHQDSKSSNYHNLTPKDQINLDFQTYWILFKEFKVKKALRFEERLFFVKTFIYFIQYSDFKFSLRFKLFLQCLLFGDINQKVLASKSFFYRSL